MPELPEVEVVRAGLAPAITDAEITAVTVHDPRALTRHAPGADHFERSLTGKQLRAAVRRGKFLWFPVTGSDHAILAHLGMSGQLLLGGPDDGPRRHERIRLDLHHPDRGDFHVAFIDQRTFGSLAIDTLEPTGDGQAGGRGFDAPTVPGQARHIGRDLLDPAVDDAAVRTAFARTRSGIKRVLLNQQVTSGIGNIYADEALWAAKVHPETPANTLSRRTVTRVLDEVRHVLTRALAEGGTSFDTQYVNVNGQAGYFSRSLNVYGKAGEPCAHCGRPLVRESFMNRSSHFCPSCQRRPRTSSRGSE